MIMAIKLNSVNTHAIKCGKHQEAVLSNSESGSEHQNNDHTNDNGEMLDEKKEVHLTLFEKIIKLLDCSNNVKLYCIGHS